MRARENCPVAVVLVLCWLGGGFAGNAARADDPPAPKTDVAKWYAEDPGRFPKLQVDPRIERAYPDIHETLAALKYALSNDQLWEGVTWNQKEDLATVRRGEIEALDDPKMVFGWKADQTPQHFIKKGQSFNDAKTQNGNLVEFHRHAFLEGNDQDQIAPRPPEEVMRTLAHELAHVWDSRAHWVTKYSADLGGAGLPYDFQKLVPSAPFSPESIRELRRLLGKKEPGDDAGPGADQHYYIYGVNTSGWSLYVGKPSEVEHRAGRSITDGGTGDTPVEFKKLDEKAFDSKEEGVKYLKTKVSPGHNSVWTGQWVKFGDGEYRTVHVGDVLKK